MKTDRFTYANLQRCQAPDGFNHKINDWSLSDWMVALIGEAGEAANIIKKLNRIRDNIQNIETETELREKLAEELADIYCYLDLIIVAAGFNLEEIVIAKFNKISERVGYKIVDITHAVE